MGLLRALGKETAVMEEKESGLGRMQAHGSLRELHGSSGTRMALQYCPELS